MKKPKTSDSGRIGLIDYVAMGIGSSLAAYSTGMAVSQPKVGQFFAMGIFGGTAIAFILRTLLARFSLIKADGILYAAGVIAGILIAPGMNASLPDGGFPHEVLTGGFLCWMMLLGSLFTWRDGTLLFQAIPSIALFGLVGCYDTFKAVPFYFFGFMLCLATVFARAHAREMLRQAVDSGFFARASAPGAEEVEPEESPELFIAVREGPWKWMAGPEWALASALAVIAISLIGAPIIRLTVAPLSGFVTVVVPPIRSAPGSAPGATSGTDPNIAKVGMGPNTMLSKEAVFAVKMDRVRYLRTAIYERYSGTGWVSRLDRTKDARDSSIASPTEISTSVDEIKQKSEYDFEVIPLVSTKVIPLPAETYKLDHQDSVRLLPDGTSELFGPMPAEAIKGRAVESVGDHSKAKVSEDRFGGEGEMGWGASEGVTRFAESVTKNVEGDYKRAIRLKEAIAARCKYNLRAAAVPDGQDPADYFLNKSQEGYCDLFATAMAQSAQAIGLPARFVYGYLPDAGSQDSSGHFIVRGTDYHAWCEIYFKDVGWIVFDATEGAEEVPNSGRGDDPNGTPFWSEPWFDTVLNGLIGLGACAGIGFYIVSLRSRKAPRAERHEAAKVYRSFQRVLSSEAGISRLPQETPSEFLRRVKPSLANQHEAASALNERFVRALYGPEIPTDAELTDLKANVKSFARALKTKPATRRETE